jgi:hypothetical protein
VGRPPIGKTAMTDAERQRRHRAQLRDSKPVTKPKPDVTRLQAENTALAKELTRAKQALQRRKRRKRGVTYYLEYERGTGSVPRRVSREVFEAAQAQFQEERVAELQAEIAALKDENTKLRGQIAKLQERQTPTTPLSKSKSAAPKPREP